MMEPQDDAVVLSVLTGDTDAFEILMRRYNRRLYRVARSIVRDSDEAEDVAQEAWVRAYTHLGQFAGDAKFSTWLTRIAVHEALARVDRRRKVMSMPGMGEGGGESMDRFESKEASPESRTGEVEARVLLEASIDALPEGYREVFVLREVEGLSSAETASCLSISEENVRARLHRARGMLRDELYARAGVVSSTAFQFLGARCDRMVRNVLDRVKTIKTGL